MSETLPAPLLTVCRLAGVSRSVAYEQRRRRRASALELPACRRPGPVGALPDRELVTKMRRGLAASPFVGEGHRRVWARLRRRGIRTRRKRVLRLTRQAGLLAPTPQVRTRAARLHEGTITVEVPDTLWATDATEAWTRREGRCAVFVLVDHASNEVFSDAARHMDRFAAADLLRVVCAERFGALERAVASALALRYDAGSCSRSDHDHAESEHLGIARSTAFHYKPETNAVAEKALPDAQGTGALDRALRHARQAAHRGARLRPHRQPTLADRTPPLPHPTEAREHPHAQRPPRHHQPVHHSGRQTGGGGVENVLLFVYH